MAAGYQDIFLEQGTTFTTQMTLADSVGAPYNLTNFTIKSQARKSYYSANVAIEFDVIATDPANGVITLVADADTTANVSIKHKMVYDVIITEGTSGAVTRILEGQIFVSPSVSR